MKEKTVGIIGGLGPEATVDLMSRVIRLTPARDDGDHLRMIVDNNPKVPSRIKALIEGIGESPGPVLAEMAIGLERWGADFLALPCNTAHFYYDEIQASVRVPLLDMIGLAVDEVRLNSPGARRVGLLASSAVLKTGLYAARFKDRGVELMVPLDDAQAELFGAIKRIKAGIKDKLVMERVKETALELAGRGAEALLVACTELSLITEEIKGGVPVYDSAEVLAREIVKQAKGGNRMTKLYAIMTNNNLLL